MANLTKKTLGMPKTAKGTVSGPRTLNPNTPPPAFMQRNPDGSTTKRNKKGVTTVTAAKPGTTVNPDGSTTKAIKGGYVMNAAKPGAPPQAAQSPKNTGAENRPYYFNVGNPNTWQTGGAPGTGGITSVRSGPSAGGPSPAIPQQPAGPATAPPGGAAPPTILGFKSGMPGPGAVTTPTGVPPTMSTNDVIANQLGTGTPTDMRGNYQDPNNPMYTGARQAMQQQLARLGSNLTGSGMGNSSYAAQLGANTLADFGGQVSTIGENAFQNDANRRLQAALASQNLNLGAQNLQMQGQGQLAGLGDILNRIGAAEQSPQNLMAILSMLGLTMGQTGSGNYNSQDVGGGYGTYNY